MCTSNSITSAPTSQVKSRGLSLASADGYRVSCIGLGPGEFLVSPDCDVPSHVVTVSADADRRRFYTCTCQPDSFSDPIPATRFAVCDHVSAVRNFLQIAPARIEELLDSLKRVASRMLEFNAKCPARPVPLASIEAKLAEAARCQEALRQSLAACVRQVEPEAAPAASPSPVRVLFAGQPAHGPASASVARQIAA